MILPTYLISLGFCLAVGALITIFDEAWGITIVICGGVFIGVGILMVVVRIPI